MNDQYFYQIDGQTVGPVARDEIRDQLRAGRIRVYDLVYREGDPSWRMLLEFSDFKQDLKESHKAAFVERPWVCLVRGDSEEYEFSTKGPFSQSEIQDAVITGEIQYTDYVWRSGFSNWQRIGLIEEFNPRLRAPSPSVEPMEPAEDLLKNVVEMKRPTIPEPELPPPGAIPLDTQEDESTTPPPIIPRVRPTSRTSSGSTLLPRKSKRKKVSWLDWGIVGIILVILGSVGWVLARNIKRRQGLEAPVTTVVETVPPEADAQEGYESEPDDKTDKEADEDAGETLEPPTPEQKTAAAPPPKPAVKVVKPPTQLFLAVQTRSQNRARIELRTNASEGFTVTVQVIGLPGQVSTGASFYKYLRLSATGDYRKPIDLSKLKLPMGRFIVRATSGDLKKEARLNIGLANSQTKATIQRMRKLYAYAIWRDRQHLFALAKTVHERMTGSAGQKLSLKGLESLRDVKLSRGHRLILIEDWFELKSIVDDAAKKVTPSLLSRAKRLRDRMANFSIWK
ncbi:MAG: DUF4339 domain-containing protein [Bdellovibrionales bacterium]